jgi:hypothetical protein
VRSGEEEDTPDGKGDGSGGCDQGSGEEEPADDETEAAARGDRSRQCECAGAHGLLPGRQRRAARTGRSLTADQENDGLLIAVGDAYGDGAGEFLLGSLPEIAGTKTVARLSRGSGGEEQERAREEEGDREELQVGVVLGIPAAEEAFAEEEYAEREEQAAGDLDHGVAASDG